MPRLDNTSPEAKARISEINARCKLKYKDKYNDAKVKYRQTEKGKMMSLKDAWIRKGLKQDWKPIWEIYKNCNNCQICDLEFNQILGVGRSNKCMDHNHTTGMFRNVICCSCNVFLGHVDRQFRAVMREILSIVNFPKVLNKLKKIE